MKTITKSIAAIAIIAGLTGCQPDNYDDKKSGIITAKTLVSYIENWKANKPKGTDGRLIIVQAGATSSGKFLSHNDKDVVVYQIPAGGSCDPSYRRHDGMTNIPGALLSGAYMDGMISTFNMNPEKDYVVFAVGKGAKTMREVVRSWWVMRYWGWDKNRLAFLDGSVDYDFSKSSGLSNYLVSNPTMPPVKMDENGKPVIHNGQLIPIAPFYTMKSVNNVQTDLQIYLADMMKIASKDNKKGYFIADARGTKEYSGEKNSRFSDDKVCGPNKDEKCLMPLQGHIRGAVDFPYTDILVLDDYKEDVNGDGKVDEKDASFKFKSPAELEKLYALKGYRKDNKIITYCRTGRKATLLTITADAVLNYPVAMYDGSWVQWGELAGGRTDVDGNEILPINSHLNLDNSKYTVVTNRIAPEYTQSSSIYDINLDATTSNKIIEEDIAYMKK